MQCYVKENNQYRYAWILLNDKEQKLKIGDIIYRENDKICFRIDKIVFKKELKFYLTYL